MARRACAIAAALALALNAWGAPAAPFANGERVSFFGDSITHGGMYCADLQLFWDLRFPGSGVRLMNCGVAGGTAGTGLARWERDLLAQKPDRIFVMFGMNDVGHSGYEAGLPAEKAESMRSTSFARYATNMTEIAARAAAAGKRLVIVTPTPYDEYTTNTSVKARPGCNSIGLARLAETCRTLAAARGAELVDLHAPLTALVERRGKFAFCRSDRVHPDLAGHIVMTAEMLSQMGVSPYVARVEIDAKAGSATLEQGAKVSRLNRAGNVLSLTYAPETLPFPTPPEYLAAAAAYPVTEKMNLEMLKVTGLPKGLYSLDADGKELGRFTAEAFAEGVNLALLPTPSAAAAMDAWKVSRELATAQGRLRNLALLESIAARHGANPEDAGAVTAKMEEFAANLRKRGSNVASYYEGQVKNYRRDKPQEAEIRRLVDSCRERLRAAGRKKVRYVLKIVPAPDEARIAAIAAALPENPGGNESFERLDREVDFPKAEKLLGSPVPDVPDALYLEFKRNGNRTHYQEAYINRRMGGFRTLVTAERVEGKGRFLPKVAEYMEAMAGQRSWVLPAHDRTLGNFYGTNLTIDLVSSHLALDLANALDSFRGRLPERTVRRVTDEIERRVFALYRADWASRQPKHWWFYGMNNWNPVCHGGVVRAALQIVPDRTDRARFVEAAMRGQPSFFAGFEEDGYCSEGMSYWEYGFGNYIDLGLAIRRATGGRFDLFAEGGARARAAAAYPFAYQLQDDVSPHFADGGGNPSVRRRKECRSIWPGVNVKGAPLPPRSIFPSAQVFISRASGARPFAVALKGGYNAERHNHNDVGTWTLMLDGVELAGDPGGEVYTARTFSGRRYESDMLNSYGHPVPRIDGQLQPAGGRFRAKVLNTEFTDAKDTVVLDLSGAYAVKGVRRLVRTAVFDRAARAFTVSDEAEFDRPMAFDVPIVTYCAVERGAAPGEFTLKGARGVAASVAASATGGEWELQEQDIENPGMPTPKRIAVAFVRPVARASVAFTIKEK